VLIIFSYLDLESLYRVGSVSHYCHDVSIHPSLYTELNLKPYWHKATNDLLCSLAMRATTLKKLDLSWCGLNFAISPTEFKKYKLSKQPLKLSCCNYLIFIQIHTATWG